MFEPEDLTPLFPNEPLKLYVSFSGLNCYAHAGNIIAPGTFQRYLTAVAVINSTVVPQCIREIFGFKHV